MTPLAKTILAAVQAEPGEWTRVALAEDLDVSLHSVSRAIEELRREGYQPQLVQHHARAQRLGRERMVAHLMQEGLSRAEIFAALQAEGLASKAAYSIMRSAGCGRIPKGEIARRLRAQGLSYAEIAAAAGCSMRMVGVALRGK